MLLDTKAVAQNVKMSAEMLAKQYSMFCAIYFMLAHLMIAQIG